MFTIGNWQAVYSRELTAGLQGGIPPESQTGGSCCSIANLFSTDFKDNLASSRSDWQKSQFGSLFVKYKFC